MNRSAAVWRASPVTLFISFSFSLNLQSLRQLSRRLPPTLNPWLPAPFPVMPSPVAIGIGLINRWRIWWIFVEWRMVARLINPEKRTVRPLGIDEKAPAQTEQKHHQAQTKHQLSHFILLPLPSILLKFSPQCPEGREVMIQSPSPACAAEAATARRRPDWIIGNLPPCPPCLPTGRCVSVVNLIKHFNLSLPKPFLQDRGE